MHAERRSDSRKRQSACIEFRSLGDIVVREFPDSLSSRHPLGIEVMYDGGSVDAISERENINR